MSSIIFINNTIYFCQTMRKEDGFKTVTNICLNKDLKEGKYLRIHHNPCSSLYNETNYGGKHISKPPILFCIWDLGNDLTMDDGTIIKEWWLREVHQKILGDIKYAYN